jgi:hypothetical protein
MSQPLSQQIDAAIAALDNIRADLTPDQVRELVAVHRSTLAQLKTFAVGFEHAAARADALGHGNVVPLWATSALATVLYRDMRVGDPAPRSPTVVSLQRLFKGRPG